MGNALDLGLAVTHGVEGFFGTREMPIGRDAAATWLAEVDVSGQFANDQDIQTCNQFGFEAGGAHQLFVANGRAKVGKKTEVLAQTQYGLLRAQRAVQGVVFPVAHCAKQYGIGLLGQGQGGFGQGVPVGLVGGPTHQRGLHLKLEVQCLQNPHRFGHDFGTNTVTRQHCNFHIHSP